MMPPRSTSRAPVPGIEHRLADEQPPCGRGQRGDRAHRHDRPGEAIGQGRRRIAEPDRPATRCPGRRVARPGLDGRSRRSGRLLARGDRRVARLDQRSQRLRGRTGRDAEEVCTRLQPGRSRGLGIGHARGSRRQPPERQPAQLGCRRRAVRRRQQDHAGAIGCQCLAPCGQRQAVGPLLGHRDPCHELMLQHGAKRDPGAVERRTWLDQDARPRRPRPAARSGHVRHARRPRRA